MQVLEALKQAVKACADVVKWGAGLQEPTRKGLAADLQAICMNCDAAYDAVLTRLVPIKNAFADPIALAAELRAFAADGMTRASFKPDHLCGQVDQLLIRLGSNLDPLKYSIDCRRINDVRQYLQRFGNFDGAMPKKTKTSQHEGEGSTHTVSVSTIEWRRIWAAYRARRGPVRA